jgi:hypothetical protein
MFDPAHFVRTPKNIQGLSLLYEKIRFNYLLDRIHLSQHPKIRIEILAYNKNSYYIVRTTTD